MSGRGAYYKNLYGGGGRGGGRGGFSGAGRGGGGSQAQQGEGDPKRIKLNNSTGSTHEPFSILATAALHPQEHPRATLTSFGFFLGDKRRFNLGPPFAHPRSSRDGRPYPAYGDLNGSWTHSTPALSYTFDLLHTQADPFAPPSKARIRLTKEQTGFPSSLWDSRIKRTALSHFLLQAFHDALKSVPSSSAGEGGVGYNNKVHRPEIVIDSPTNQVVERTAVRVDEEGELEVRFQVALPARGRSILSQPCTHLLTILLPSIISRTLLSSSHAPLAPSTFITSIVQQSQLRSLLPSQNLVAFIPFGAVLPRKSGASGEQGCLVGPDVKVFGEEGLMRGDVYEFELAGGKKVRGMGIRKGEVVVVCGGGFHGKSTLMKAIGEGCWDHVPGDGREFVVSCESVTQVRSEDGRSVTEVDISPFITNLPNKSDTTKFSTEDASGSTSCAASLIEALDAGSELICLDEDTCATNFLIRDARMQMLVSAELEPITPLVHMIQALVKSRNTAIVLVIGGCGEYLDVADVVLQMDNYEVRDVTQRAKEVARQIPSSVAAQQASTFPSSVPRTLLPSSLSRLSSETRVKTLTTTTIQHTSLLDLSALESLVSISQTRALEFILRAGASWGKEEVGLKEWVGKVEEMLEREGGLDELIGMVDGERGVGNGMLARPRRMEVEMAVNRLRGAVLKRSS